MKKVSLIKEDPYTIYVDNCVMGNIYAYKECGIIRTLKFDERACYWHFSSVHCMYFPTSTFHGAIEAACSYHDVYCFTSSSSVEWLTNTSQRI